MIYFIKSQILYLWKEYNFLTSFTIPGIICTADAPFPTTPTTLSFKEIELSQVAECIKGPLKFLNISGTEGFLSAPGHDITKSKLSSELVLVSKSSVTTIHFFIFVTQVIFVT